MRWLACIMALALFASMAQAQEKQTARPQVGEPVQQAGQLLKERKYKEALAKLATADAVRDKTAYERYVIEGTRAAIDQASGDYPGTIKALQAVLATGILPPAEAAARLQTIVQLDYQVKDYRAVIADAGRYYQQGGTAEEPRQLEAQAYYLQSDFADALKTLRAVIAADDKAGRKPDENLLLTLLNSEFQQNDQAGRIETLKRLVALYPKPQYWSNLLTAVGRQPGFADRLTLDLDRLKLATGAMTAANDYMEAAQLALLDELPGDAKAFLDKGYATGALGKDTQVDRENRLRTMVGQQVATTDKSLAQQAAAANDAAALEKLGETYASASQYDKAIAAYSQALQKGGLAHPDDARLHLGLAYLASGQKAKAREILGSVSAPDGARDLAQLWMIKAGL
ncbi:MAG TPA: tetratricopeptide repeat protein [Stellaceae bacterium]|nr:tetratricopeptide repeat protein [Stellaceae bacterium]